ncbi:G2 and S phase-expressed protein 1 isoform X1 [Rhineura floridana]|uniref:G2 and S phase-expressed protein 1 isoform X1 n=1 Tax=Rhineura floridana TaxID=261503 RepID=UPI002AC832B5|nr:G2 and S phase-expressed protein 1 isoform X1 [Rhineura floridana]XP_061496276.1 G2 and S phase-expressed protein 1 isoform X1 [Rhineura floridana]XP_061496277.1 G2 and S phase-expressed protein 1 isoform X1 [Rhineura floridana]XP_061496278.1 G2 and S phase-expressed protein 1 isoform X1 [Rhineura floridana]XP_061496279.1 G2 and S phase-expressed protein 1 isoform X1 [Rhineura floridana]XP_061496283.1 G2 and S phase-expressed protein 1 isoform X1 [Rhineura floridana]
MDEKTTTLHSECKMMDVKPNECVNNDFHLLTDEKFDFDLSLSPTSENEDEVFVGPVGHKEKCIAVSLKAQEGTEDKILPPPHVDELTWSPLAGEKFVEIFKEAHLVALQLQSASKAKRNNSGELEERKTEVVEKFVQESKSKLKIFEKGIEMDKDPKAIKRETYCVWESPVYQLPPSFQKHSRQPITGMYDSHSLDLPLNTSSPGKMGKLPQASVLPLAQEKSEKTKKKPSASQTIKNSSVFGNRNLLAAGEPKQGKLPSTSSRNNLNSMGSSEDLLSDKSSIASDSGDLSFSNSSSVQDKRALPTPSKLGIKPTQLKPPSNIRMRRITSSSSSSSSLSSMNSSLNSSLSISPNRGKGKIGVTSANGSRLSGASKISIARPMKGLSVQASHSVASGKQHRSASATKGNPPVNVPKYRAIMSETASGIWNMGSDSSLQKLLKKNTLGNIRGSSSPKSKTVPPVSKEGIYSEKVAARILQPVGSLSCDNVGGNVAVTPPVKQSEDGLVLNSCSTVKSALRTPVNIKYSGLPTPIGRCISGIPTMTPKTLPKLMSSPNLLPLRRVSSVSSKKTLTASSKWAKESRTWGTSSSSSTGDISPPQVVPVALNFSPDESSTEIEDFSAQEKPAGETPTKESLLIDIGKDKTPITTQEYENKPLIDLFNTPEIIKVPQLKPTGLPIDLSYPLIILSPEGNKENLDFPLL